jgi:translation initiation factor 4B
LSDWTRKGPLPDLPNQQRRASDRQGFKSYGDAPEMERGGSRRGGAGGAPFEGDGRSRDFGNWERRGPLSPIPNEQGKAGEGRARRTEPGRERKSSPSWGEGRSNDGSRPPRGEPRESRESREPRERPPPVERQPTAADLDNEWRARMRPDASKSNTPTPNPSTPSSPAPKAAVPVGRPRLNLSKRTVSEAEPPSGGAEVQASIFGGARPIDTAAREREVVAKREQVLKQKREADEKAKEEKKAAQETAAKSVAEASEEGDEDAEEPNGESAPPKSYTILTKQKEAEVSENGDKESPAEKPKESRSTDRADRGNRGDRGSRRGPPRDRDAAQERDAPRDAPKGPRGGHGSWRRKSSTPSSPATSAAPEGAPADADGWSTVQSKPRGGPRGRGGQSSRAGP